MSAPDIRRAFEPNDRLADVLVIGDAASLRFAVDITDAIVDWIEPGPSAEYLLPILRSGVVVVVVPPADAAMVGRVARVRRDQPRIRAVLVDPAGAPEQRLAALEAGFDEALPQELGAAEIAAR